MSSAAKREAIRYTTKQYAISERRACRAIKIPRSTIRYKRQRADDDQVRNRLRELAMQRRRFGSPRLTVMLNREGFKINHKRVERIYAEEGLQVKKRQKRRATSALRIDPHSYATEQTLEHGLCVGQSLRWTEVSLLNDR